MHIRDQKDFKKAWDLVNKVFDINKHIPEKKIRRSSNLYLYEEFDWTMSPDFWGSFLRPLAQASNDTEILVAVLDPDPVNYYYKHFGYYNMFVLPTHSTESDYWNMLAMEPEGSPADAILFNSEVVVWIPISEKWAIWGERSLEECVLAFSDDCFGLEVAELTKMWRAQSSKKI